MPTDTLPVVVGTDGSPPALLAVEWGAADAARHSRPLHLLHVAEPLAPLYPLPAMPEWLSEAGRTVLNESEQHAHSKFPAIQVTTELVEGHATDVLRDRSKSAFEIVLGQRGQGGFGALLLGSTGLRVSGYAEGPVIIVRGSPRPEHGEVVVGINLYEDSSALLEYAFKAATTRGARLRTLHAFQLAAPLIADDEGTIAGELIQNMRRRMSQLLEPWRVRHPDTELIEEIIAEHPVAALTNASSRADLLVVAARGHHALSALMLGSVSHGCVHHAHCPVAVVGPQS